MCVLINKTNKSVSGVALLVAGAFFMEFLDGTVIATALPQMAHTFATDVVRLNLGISAYLLTLAVLIPVSGWIADRYGAKNVFSLALVIFTLSSVLCGLSENLTMFVAMRILQGAGGALMVPVGRLAVLKNTPPEQLITAIATLTWPALVAPIIGPPLGGFITTWFDWRWIFFLNLPLGMIAFMLSRRLMKNSSDTGQRPFDITGFILSALSMIGVVCSMEMVSSDIPLPLTLGLSVISLAGLRITWWHMKRVPCPMIRMDALSIPTFRATLIGGFLFRSAISAIPFLLPLMFQTGFHMDAFHSGLLVLAVFAGNLAIKPATTRILRTFGFKTVLTVNGLLNVVAMVACAFFTPQTAHWLIMLVLFIGGMFRSLQFTAINTLVFCDVPKAQMSHANALFSASSQLSMGAGITFCALSIYLAGRLGQTSQWLHGLPAVSFRLSFIALGVLCLIAMADILLLEKNAGSQVTAGKKASS